MSFYLPFVTNFTQFYSDICRVTSIKVLGVTLKGIGKEFQESVIRRYLEKINTEETFLPFTVITNKDYFSRKKLNLQILLSRYIDCAVPKGSKRHFLSFSLFYGL